MHIKSRQKRHSFDGGSSNDDGIHRGRKSITAESMARRRIPIDAPLKLTRNKSNGGPLHNLRFLRYLITS